VNLLDVLVSDLVEDLQVRHLKPLPLSMREDYTRVDLCARG
jgi:hypothetical protein